MTVADLIEKLKEMPQDAPVAVHVAYPQYIRYLTTVGDETCPKDKTVVILFGRGRLPE